MAGARIRNGFIDDPRNYLFKHYFNIVRTVKPKAFVIENVKGIKSMQDGKIFAEILRLFRSDEELGFKHYNLYYRIIKAVDFGIPQKRERMIIIGVQKESVDFDSIWMSTVELIKKQIPNFFDKVTVRDAIGNLPSATINGIIDNPKPKSRYQEFLSSKEEKLYNHDYTHHSDVAINRMKKIKNGENYTVLDEQINSVHSGAYGRLSWDEQAPTITTRFDTPAGGRFIHPSEDRTLTPREAARIQSFPDDFVFYGPRTTICREIGNAVPPKISYFLSKFIDNILEAEEE
jgi:DNA (cytosine-5)-methyltransferase 1